MFHSRKLNRKINHLHERALRLVYDDYTSYFDDLLQKDGSVSIHHRNIQNVATLLCLIVGGGGGVELKGGVAEISNFHKMGGSI